MDRAEILERVRTRQGDWDIVVIGGGATGVGCAVDAASRGLDVLLLEQHDFGKGTSSRSTKLAHGGVRYLAQGNVSLVREALKERGILFRNAPHAVRKQAFVVPCYSLWQKFYYGFGLKVYDLLAWRYSFGRSRMLSGEETLERLPNVRSEGLAGGIIYYDGQFDDARLLIDLVRTAYKNGAALLNYAKVSTINKDDKERAIGIGFEDVLSGERFDIGAKVVINATGAFCDAVRRLSDRSVDDIVTLSQGVHLVFDRRFLPSENALMIPKTSDGRVLFLIPWQGRTLVGTTDTPVDSAVLEPKAQDNEIDFILRTAAAYLTESPKRSDIRSIFTGIRPLVKDSNTKNTASLSRGHLIEVDRSGLLTITGGKWTTYRRMAEDTIDLAVKLASLPAHPCRTRDLRICFEPEPADGEKLHARLPYTRADVLRAVRREMAQTVEDVLARRTRALFLDAAAAVKLAPRVAELMAAELNKDGDWIDAQIEAFRAVAAGYLQRQ